MTGIETISLLADIATLLGLIFAIYVFSKWKLQSDYSFKRDVIFRSELATLDTFATLITTIQTYGECKRIYLVNGNSQDPQYLKQDYIDKKKQLDQKIQNYHENLVKLNISNIKIDETIIFSKEVLVSKFEGIIKDIHAINNPNEIPVKLNNIIIEIGILSNRSIEFLSNARKNT